MADEKQERDRLFEDGKSTVNVSNDIVALLKEDAKKERLYASQVLDKILRAHYTKEKRLS